MGILFVLIFYFAVLGVAAVVSASVLVAGTRWYLREASPKRSKALKLAGAFPFACVLFAGMWFIGYWVINETIFDHDPMLGDGWHTQLGNGYAIDMIDVTDFGCVHPAGASCGADGARSLQGVRRMQVVGKRIFGSEDTKTFQESGTERTQEDVFFALNTDSANQQQFASEAELRDYARQTGVALKLEPIEKVYWQHRSLVFEWVAFAVLLGVPLTAFVWLVRYVRSVRWTGEEDEGLSIQS